MSFVGSKQVSSAEELKQLLDQFYDQNSCYFLRWPHKVSGFISQLTEFPSPEGQMFNSDYEIRWKQRGAGYDVLFLGTSESNQFQPIGQQWLIIDRNAEVYRNETRFPKGFDHQNLKIGQRYFMDQETSTIRFVALRIK